MWQTSTDFIHYSYNVFKNYLRQAVDRLDNPDGMNPTATVIAAIQQQAGQLPFSEIEIKTALELAEGDGIVQITDDEIVII